MKSNYHTHTYLCGHAIGDVKDYVSKAIELGFKILGMSDHGIIPPKYKRVYMDEKSYQGYLKKIDETIIAFPNIKIYKGIEVEYFRGNDDFYKKLYDELDYMILGVHYYLDTYEYIYHSSFDIIDEIDLNNYCDIAVAGMETGYFKILAHPDLFMFGYGKWNELTEKISRRIIECAIRNNVLLEINSQGIRNSRKEKYLETRYPNIEFFKLVKEYNAKVVISADAHEPSKLYDSDVIKAIDFSRDLGLEVVEVVNMDK